jgi:hypothetical protein
MISSVSPSSHALLLCSSVLQLHELTVLDIDDW